MVDGSNIGGVGEEAILLRLGPELRLAGDRTPHSPRRRTPVGFVTPLIVPSPFRYDTEKLLRKQDETAPLCGRCLEATTTLYMYLQVFLLL